MTDQFALTEDQIAIQDMARRFTADAITPFAAQWDEDHTFPRETIKAAAELGFAAIYVSEESGGIGLGRLEAALIMEAMAYGCPTTSAFISIHNMAAWMIDTFGGDDLKARYLPSLVSMDLMASYCLTEPGSGSDAAALKTTARRDGDDYVLNGTKSMWSWCAPVMTERRAFPAWWSTRTRPASVSARPSASWAGTHRPPRK
jgi:alkylation response protein AidB-like acyl-CoA dehydrogenase